jgi:hypothetical protein
VQPEKNDLLAEDQPVQAAMQNIAGKLSELAAGAKRLQVLYEEYAEASDLTFIKILEDKYAMLGQEIQSIHDMVLQLQTGEDQTAAGVSGNGG